MAGKTWIQSTPPPAGVTYEWAGAPHASASIKKVDGVEVARNLVTNPSFEDPAPLAGIMSSSSTVTISSVTTAQTVHAGSRALGVVIENANSSAGWVAQDFTSFSPGGWIAMSVRARNSVGMAPGLRFYFNFYDASGGSLDPSGYVGGDVMGSNSEPGNMTVLTVAIPLPADATRARGFLRPREAVTFGRYHTDAWIAAVGATEAEALEKVADYFDGDTPDDREGDTWLNPEEYREYVWDSATKDWIPNPAAASLSDNLFVDPFFDQGMTHWTSGAQGGGTQGAVQGLSDINTLPGHRHSFALGPYVSGVTSQAAGPNPLAEARPQVRQGDVLQGAAWVMRGPGTPKGTETVELRPWRNPPTGVTVAGTMASIRVADMPVGEWVELSGSWTLTDAGEYGANVRVYYSPGSGGWGNDAPGVWIGYQFTTVNPGPPKGGITEVGAATVDRRGLVSETFARSREKISLQLAEPDERLRGGERIELAAFAASSSEVTWRWRQITGPEVFLVREGNTCYFQAPDVDSPTDMRVAVSASSVDGSNRSDWHFFDLEILPTVGRFAAEESDGFLPYTPQMVGYNRGKREIWNDVIAPVGMDPEGRKEPKLVDLGIPADDVTFSLDGEEPARASAGAVYVDLRDGAIYRNFGGGYNETDDTTGAPRRNAYMVNPATGEVFEWIEEADDGR